MAADESRFQIGTGNDSAFVILFNFCTLAVRRKFTATGLLLFSRLRRDDNVNAEALPASFILQFHNLKR
jgi:hypothetical protein